jgi:hypothetical protein
MSDLPWLATRRTLRQLMDQAYDSGRRDQAIEDARALIEAKKDVDQIASDFRKLLESCDAR